MIRFFTILSLLFLFQNCSAQKGYTTEKTAKKKQLENFRKGQRLSFNGQFGAAIKELEKLLRTDPTFIDAQIEWANVKNQQGKFAEAEQGYEKALAIDPNYLPGVLYSLAIVEFDQKKFGESAAHMEKYLATGKIKERRKKAAGRYLNNAKFAAEALANPVPFDPKNMGANINSPDYEYLPTLTADGEKLIFTKRKRGLEDFYISHKINGEWQKAVPIESVNTPENEGSQTVSADGKLLIYTGCNRKGGYGMCDLYFTEYKNGEWTPVKNIGPPINTNQWEGQPSLSADGQILYFCRDPKGGRGNIDIWVSYRMENGEWGAPKKLPETINSKGKEQVPFLHPDGQTLYFSSDGHPGMGKADIYFSRLLENGEWGKPENIGYPINTEKNESALFVGLNGKTAYFASDQEGGFGKTDIYSFELYEAARPQPVTYVKAIVSDAHSRKKLMAKVEFIDLKTGKIYSQSMTGADGEFLITLPIGKDYALNVSKDKYLFYSENFALKNNSTADDPFELKIELTPVPETSTTNGEGLSKPIILKNVFFETGSAALKNESLAELERLKKLLDDNPNLKIQINGHTDNIGTEEDNLNLSSDRAKAVYDYLIKNNIAAERLKYKGFGETMPIASNGTDEGRQQNRRTEFVAF
ncbi:MAG TPA: flagellar motor protein MotB [Bacteroidetes bacterium]|nr:flagellar motor protein MotB [Bacteroidota bacterium]